MFFWTRQKAVGTSYSSCTPFDSSLQPGEFLHWHLWPDSKFLYCSKTAKQLGQGAESLSEFILLKLEVWSCLANKISLHHSPCSYALQRVLWTRWWKAIKRTANTEIVQISSYWDFCTKYSSFQSKIDQRRTGKRRDVHFFNTNTFSLWGRSFPLQKRLDSLFHGEIFLIYDVMEKSNKQISICFTDTLWATKLYIFHLRVFFNKTKHNILENMLSVLSYLRFTLASTHW